MRTRILLATMVRSAAGLVLGAALPGAAVANDTCNGFINIDYVGAPPLTPIGDTVDVKLSFGSGSIQGGTKLTINSFQFNLDCNATFPLAAPCTDEGPIVQYEGDGNLTTDCPTTFTTGQGVNTDPNKVVFTANPPLDIPPNVSTLPGFCTVQFRVRVLAASIDGVPGIQQVAGYDVGACDNGVLLSGGFQSSQIDTPPPLHFSCYEIVQGNIPDITGVTLEDRFGTTTASVTELKRLCAPTNKNGEDPGAEAAPDHLVSYIVKTTGGSFQKPKNVNVVNQFGAVTVNVVAPVFLQVPSSKSLVPPPLPPLANTDVSHFQCYRLDSVKGAPANKGITLLDQFGPLTVDLDKRGPFRLCVPVNKNGEDPGAKDNPAVMLCYTTRNDRLPFGSKQVVINNQFGPLGVKLTQYDELCVPSTILP